MTFSSFPFQYGATAISKYALSGNLVAVKWLIANMALPDVKEGNGCTPAHVTAMNGHTGCLKELMKAGAKADTLNDQRRTPMHSAAHAGHTECLQTLLNANGNPDIADVELNTAMDLAARRGHVECTRMLIEAGGAVSSLMDDHLKRSDTTALLTLLEAGVDPNIKNTRGYTAIHIAAQFGLDVQLTMLIAAGANSDPLSKTGWRPIHDAAQYGMAECLKILLDNGALLERADMDGDTPMHCAALNGHADCLQLLLDAGAKFDVEDDNGLMPVHFAAQEGNVECLQTLVTAGAVPDCKEIVEGNTPLHFAAQHGHAECIQFLLGIDVKPDTQNDAGLTPLKLARKPACRKLLQTGAQDGLIVNLQNSPNSVLDDSGATDEEERFLNVHAGRGEYTNAELVHKENRRKKQGATIRTLYGKHVETLLREFGDSSTIFKELLLMAPQDSTLKSDTFKRLVMTEADLISKEKWVNAGPDLKLNTVERIGRLDEATTNMSQHRAKYDAVFKRWPAGMLIDLQISHELLAASVAQADSGGSLEQPNPWLHKGIKPDSKRYLAHVLQVFKGGGLLGWTHATCSDKM